MRFSLVCCGWMLLTAYAFANAAVNITTTLFVNHGQSAKINCNYNLTNDTERMTVKLETLNYSLCTVTVFMNSWKKNSCKDHISFKWIPETTEISFELLNLQIQDNSTYTCTVKRIVKPPEVDLGIERVRVIVRPVLFLSCVKRPDESPMILCSVRYCHDSLEQRWVGDGGVLNKTYSHKSLNGSFTYESYLILPPQNFNDTIYSCWVNHSSLNKPLVANLSSSVCYERADVTVTVTATAVIVIVVLTVFLITTLIICEHYRSERQPSESPVRVSVTPEPVLYDELQSEALYSTLGNHHPVRCSTVRVLSSENKN